MHFTLLTIVLMSVARISHPELSPADVIEIMHRDVTVQNYPQPGTTYLMHDNLHGYQIHYFGPDGEAWLWYPGYRVALPGGYRRLALNDQTVLCQRQDKRGDNPVARRGGGRFACTPMVLAERTTIAAQPGDVFNLASGGVPYSRTSCDPTDRFDIDTRDYPCIR